MGIFDWQSTINPAPAQPSPDALANALTAGQPLTPRVSPDEFRRRHTMANALAQPAQGPMTSPMQVVAAGVNGAINGYLDSQKADASQQALAQATAQASGVQGPIQPASAIFDNNKLSLPSFDIGSMFGNWGS